MPSIDRRAVLASVAGLAGCASDRQPTVRSSPETDQAETDPQVTGRLVLDPTVPEDVDGSLAVLPDDLRRWLRRAVTEETTVRNHGSGYVYPVVQTYEPIPPLTGFDRVRVDDSGADVAGTYTLDAEGGVRYDLLVGAEAVTPPADATVTPVDELSGRRRELALAAIGAESGHDGRVFPETELGSWVRSQFFDGYFRYDGTVYRGYEVQQTDAAFSATAVWYVFSLSAAEVDGTTTLRLTDFDDRARELVDDLRSENETVERMERDVEGRDAAAAEMLATDHPFLLTHDAVYQVTFVY